MLKNTLHELLVYHASAYEIKYYKYSINEHLLICLKKPS